jgi:ubiquitin-like protein Pup
MTEREQKRRTTESRTPESVEHEAAPSVRAEDLKNEMDDLLDEIDSVLEENAEEFVRNYVQKGGE